ATDTATQACIAEAISASPIHSADANQILSIPNPLIRWPGSRRNQPSGGQNETRRAAGYEKDPAMRWQMPGVISPCGRFWGTPSPRFKINRVSPLVNNGSRAGLLASPKEGETGQN